MKTTHLFDGIAANKIILSYRNKKLKKKNIQNKKL